MSNTFQYLNFQGESKQLNKHIISSHFNTDQTHGAVERLIVVHLVVGLSHAFIYVPVEQLSILPTQYIVSNKKKKNLVIINV